MLATLTAEVFFAQHQNAHVVSSTAGYWLGSPLVRLQAFPLA